MTLLKSAGRLGGKIATERVDGFVVEAGPDTLFTGKPAVSRLLGELEAIWVAAEMRAGAAYAHSLIAVEALDGASSGTMATAGSPDADRAAG